MIKLTTTPSLLPGRINLSVDETDTGVNICSGSCWQKNLGDEVKKGLDETAQKPGQALPKTHPLYTTWQEITEVLLAAALCLLFFISTGYAQGTVNLRACPSTACPVVATLDEGDVVLPAPGTGETWIHVHTDEGDGWIYGLYMEYVP